MIRLGVNIVVSIAITLSITGCGAEANETASHSKEQLLLLGEWQQKTDGDSTINWKFTIDDLTWSGFTHNYKVEEKTIIVSGMTYEILCQSNDSLKVKTPQGDTALLIKGEK